MFSQQHLNNDNTNDAIYKYIRTIPNLYARALANENNATGILVQHNYKQDHHTGRGPANTAVERSHVRTTTVNKYRMLELPRQKDRPTPVQPQRVVPYKYRMCERPYVTEPENVSGRNALVVVKLLAQELRMDALFCSFNSLL